jgi:hypothetical protein
LSPTTSLLSPPGIPGISLYIYQQSLLLCHYWVTSHKQGGSESLFPDPRGRGGGQPKILKIFCFFACFLCLFLWLGGWPVDLGCVPQVGQWLSEARCSCYNECCCCLAHHYPSHTLTPRAPFMAPLTLQSLLVIPETARSTSKVYKFEEV